MHFEPWENSKSLNVGEPAHGKARAVLIKFTYYQPVERLHKARKSHSNIYKDLTNVMEELAVVA